MAYEIKIQTDTDGRVTCDICGSTVQRRGLSRHQSTGLCHALSQVKLTQELMSERDLVSTDISQDLLSRAGVSFEVGPHEASREGRTIRIKIGAYVAPWVRDAWKILRSAWSDDRCAVLLVLCAMHRHSEFREGFFVADRMAISTSLTRWEIMERRQALITKFAAQVKLV